MAYIKKGERFSWDKSSIKKVIELWETSTVEKIAEELNTTRTSIMYMANQIRKEGYKLPKKKRVNVTRGLIREVLREL